MKGQLAWHENEQETELIVVYFMDFTVVKVTLVERLRTWHFKLP